jgi:hypothetical protein
MVEEMRLSMANGILMGPQFTWNIETNVGPGCPNKIEDVQLVQLGYLCKANNPKIPATPEEKAIYGAVVPGSAYSGSPSDPLTIAIKYHQKLRGGTQDGHVSSIKNTTNGGYYSGNIAWMLLALTNNIADALGDHWPRLDKHPQCPAALKAASLRVLTVTPA